MGNIIFTNNDYWRAVILYGLNTATYKIALAQCLISIFRARPDKSDNAPDG
jgi:hypothetical protein